MEISTKDIEKLKQVIENGNIYHVCNLADNRGEEFIVHGNVIIYIGTGSDSDWEGQEGVKELSDGIDFDYEHIGCEKAFVQKNTNTNSPIGEEINHYEDEKEYFAEYFSKTEFSNGFLYNNRG